MDIPAIGKWLRLAFRDFQIKYSFGTLPFKGDSLRRQWRWYQRLPIKMRVSSVVVKSSNMCKVFDVAILEMLCLA